MFFSPPLVPRTRLFLAGVAVLLSSVLLGLAGCLPSKPAPAVESSGPGWFEDVTEREGLDFVHDPGAVGGYFMPQSMGSGAAAWQEGGALYLYLVNNGGPGGRPNRLYRRGAAGPFRDVTAGSGLGVSGFGMGVAVGDVDNDGRPDVVLTEYGRVRLYLNRGGGRFEDVTAEAGLSNPLWGASAAFLDYDRDGRLDLVVVNYLDYDPKRDCPTPKGEKDFCGPSMFQGTCSKLFHNLGPSPASAGTPARRVRFEDVSFASRVGRLPGPGLGVACADFTGDGWPDIFVSNDGKANRLWVNQKDGTFRDEAASRGVGTTMTGKAYAGMGVAVGDTANRGVLDLFVTHLGSETHTLWRQGPPGLFADGTVAAGLAASGWRGTGFGAVMADFDLDGSLDVALVNGRVVHGGTARDSGLGFWETYAERNQLFANDGAGKFRDVSAAAAALCGRWNVGRGLLCLDYDGDGTPDLLVTSIGGAARLLRGTAGKGHWLKVRAVDPRLRRDAYGAAVRLRAGGRGQLRVVGPAESYLCGGLPLAHFGLGGTDRYDALEVDWPDGPREAFAGGAADRAVELRRGEGTPR